MYYILEGGCVTYSSYETLDEVKEALEDFDYYPIHNGDIEVVKVIPLKVTINIEIEDETN